jgi:hypothetical protein
LRKATRKNGESHQRENISFLGIDVSASRMGTSCGLVPGKWADFILIDHDLFKIEPADIWKIKVEQTWVPGKRMF